MRVLGACSLGGAGHLQPLLPWLAAARSAGHETLIVAPPSLAEQAGRAGHPFAAGAEPPESLVAPIREALPLAPPARASVLGNRELFGRLATEAMVPAMRRVLNDWRPQLVLRDPCEFASAVVTAELGMASAQVAIDLAAGEWRSLRVAAPAVDAHRPDLTERIRRVPYLSRFPASLDPSPFPDTRRYRHPPAPNPDLALPDWWAGAAGPLVYVTLGTVTGHLSLAAAAYRTVLRAVVHLSDVRVLLTVGHRFDAAQLGPLPAHVHVAPWVDQDAVFRQADLVVCHGGSGTTFGALAAGVPVVVVPLFAGQFTNGAAIAAAGAGECVRGTGQGKPRKPVDESDVPAIRQAVDRVRCEPSYRAAALRIATEMANAPNVSTVLASLLAAR